MSDIGPPWSSCLLLCEAEMYIALVFEIFGIIRVLLASILSGINFILKNVMHLFNKCMLILSECGDMMSNFILLIQKICKPV